jgi:hypothetical protein
MEVTDEFAQWDTLMKHPRQVAGTTPDSKVAKGGLLAKRKSFDPLQCQFRSASPGGNHDANV